MAQFCRGCGAQLNPGTKFCGSCGAAAAVPSMPAQNTSPPPSPVYTDNAGAKKRRLPPAKILIPITAAALVLAVGIGLLPRLLGGGNYPLKEGASVEHSIQAGKRAKVGDANKTGWELDIPEDTFSEDGKLTMKVLSESEAGALQTDDFTFYGTPAEFSFDGQEHAVLGAPVTVTLQIPKDLIEDLAAEKLFFATWYNGQWEYLLPDSVDPDKGTAAVEIYHFSLWGFGKPSEAKQIEAYAQNMAALQWERENKSKKLRDALSRQYDDLFASMGIESESVRGQLTGDVISALEDGFLDTGGVAPIDALAQMANAASKGDNDAFQNKLLEFTGKAICSVMEKDAEKFGSYANVLGGLGTAAGAISAGDTEGALRGVADILKGSHPMVAVTDSALTFVKEKMQESIDIWSQGELEKGYQVYVGGAAGRWGEDSGLDGDLDGIFITMGGGERAFTGKIVKKYCEKYGIKESELSQADRDVIISNAKTALQRKFDERRESEAGIAEIKAKEEAFISALRTEGLLASYSYRKFFGQEKGGAFDVGDRLAKLYQLRSLVLGYVDDDKTAELTDAQITVIIRQWIVFSEKKDRAGFFKYLRDSGFVVEPLKNDPAFAWVLVDTIHRDMKDDVEHTNKGGVYEVSASASPGNYTYSWKYIGESDDYYKPPTIHGESYATLLTFSVPPEVIRGGETVTLGFSLSFTDNNLSGFDGRGYARADWGNLRFANADGKSGFEIYSSVKYSEKNVLSVSDTLFAVIPAGFSEGDRETLWTGGYTGTDYVYEWRAVS